MRQMVPYPQRGPTVQFRCTECIGSLTFRIQCWKAFLLKNAGKPRHGLISTAVQSFLAAFQNSHQNPSAKLLCRNGRRITFRVSRNQLILELQTLGKFLELSLSGSNRLPFSTNMQVFNEG
jgi:hypothetical protein